MSRELSLSMLAALGDGTLRPAVFYEGVFAAGTVRLWTGIGPIDWNGQSWTGAGTLLGISEINETADLRAANLTVSLSGISSEVIALVLDQARLGKTGSIWFGLLREDGQVIADPYLAFAGRMDVPSIKDAGETCTVAISYESELRILQKTNVRRYTHEDFQIDNPGDLFCQYVAAMQDQVVVW